MEEYRVSVTMCKCKWRHPVSGCECDKTVWEKSDKYCIFHEPNKDAEDFEQWNQELKKKKDRNFAGYHFPAEGVSFANTIFEQKADFSYVTFHGEAIFVEAVFCQSVSFLKACFQGEADFSGVEFHQDANFTGAVFQQEADFRVKKFHEVFFESAEFQQEARFTRAKFILTANFRNATFRFAFFNGAHFNSLALFQETTFQERMNFSEVECCPKIMFNNAKFPKDTNFHNTVLTNCEFYGSNIEEANLTGANWGKKITKNEVIPEERDREYEKAEKVYRSIKHSYKKSGDYDLAADFYYREMECVRKQKHPFKLKRVFTRGFIWHSIILRRVCGYGEKPGRALAWAAIIILFFAVLYYPNPLGHGWIELNAEWKHQLLPDFVKAVHFSIITFATLGYGNIHPVNLPANVVTAIEVILGYLMFGVLVTLVVRKIARN